MLRRRKLFQLEGIKAYLSCAGAPPLATSVSFGGAAEKLRTLYQASEHCIKHCKSHCDLGAQHMHIAEGELGTLQRNSKSMFTLNSICLIHVNE